MRGGRPQRPQERRSLSARTPVTAAAVAGNATYSESRFSDPLSTFLLLQLSQVFQIWNLPLPGGVPSLPTSYL